MEQKVKVWDRVLVPAPHRLLGRVMSESVPGKLIVSLEPQTIIVDADQLEVYESIHGEANTSARLVELDLSSSQKYPTGSQVWVKEGWLGTITAYNPEMGYHVEAADRDAGNFTEKDLMPPVSPAESMRRIYNKAKEDHQKKIDHDFLCQDFAKQIATAAGLRCDSMRFDIEYVSSDAVYHAKWMLRAMGYSADVRALDPTGLHVAW